MTGVAQALDPDQRRINEVLIAYWQSLRGGRAFPNHSEVDFSRLGAIWDSCFLVRYDPDGSQRYGYLYLGSLLVEAYGDDLSEREICERLVFPSSMSLTHKFDEVVEKREPVMEETDFVNSRGAPVRYRSIMLPLGDGGGNVGYILGGMRWKRY